MREKLLTLTKKDFRIDTYRGSGPGGQHRNKTDSCVRITHPLSGRSASCCKHRSQARNKKEAFIKLVKDKQFLSYIKAQATGIAQAVEEAMQEHNILTEVWENNEWKIAKTL